MRFASTTRDAMKYSSGLQQRGELDGIASAHIEKLSAALPGFAEAMAWPVG